MKRLEEEIGIQPVEKAWANPEYREKDYPFDSQIAGALGAALFAYTLLEKGKVKGK